MGDRTYCAVTIHKHYYNQLIQELGEKELEKIIYSDETEIDGDEVRFVCYEANYGNWEELTNLLVERNIEYDRRWESGGDYGPGNEYARIVNGEYILHNIYDDGDAIVDELKIFLNETDPIKMRELVEKRLLELEPFKIEPLKLPNSIDFIKNA